jgi:hypothetical protein
MGADITRDTFDKTEHFRRVLAQQGRVLLDADFNEQTAIVLHYLQTLAADIIGPSGGPADPSNGTTGFEVKLDSSATLTIGKGRYYVYGILCENDQDLLAYLAQDGYSKLQVPDLSQYDFIYLDVWERVITAIQDDAIREPALGGPDTCARARTVWQVKLGTGSPRPSPNSDHPCQPLTDWLATLPSESNATLKVTIPPQNGDTDPCSISPASRYRGLENQLYRVEIHRGGSAWDGTPGNAASAATFTWSRDNASVTFPIVSESGKVVTLESLGRDATLSLEVDDWVEIVDDDVELVGSQPGILSGILAQVDAIDPVALTVTLRPPADVIGITWPSYDASSTNHPFLRRWDQREADGLTFSEGAILISEATGDDPGSWIAIEDGIAIQFQPPAAGASPTLYRAGDYWLVPARVATGDIEWPRDAQGNSEALAPFGIVHAYAPLAMITQGPPIALADCRCAFQPMPCTTPGKKLG